MKLREIPIAELHPPLHSVRCEIDEEKLAELAEDIKRNGVLVPLQVKAVTDGFEVVDGHRRLLASMAAGVASAPCLVITGKAAEFDVRKLTANLYRQEMSPVEESAFFAELFESSGSDVDAVCARVGKSRAYVEGRLLLLAGDADVLRALAGKRVSMAVAHELNLIEDKQKRGYYLEWAVSQGATAKLVKFWRQSANMQAAVDAGTVQPHVAPQELLDAARDLFKCFICGEQEPTYDLRVHHIHRACRQIVEQNAVRSPEPDKASRGQ